MPNDEKDAAGECQRPGPGPFRVVVRGLSELQGQLHCWRGLILAARSGEQVQPCARPGEADDGVRYRVEGTRGQGCTAGAGLMGRTA